MTTIVNLRKAALAARVRARSRCDEQTRGAG